MKVLIVQWLRHDGAVALGDLASEVGCSYPTVRAALGRRSLARAVRSHSNRSVELTAFPGEAWQELIALSRTMRKEFCFRNRSSSKPDVEGLLKRLGRHSNLPVGVGGVIAARHWDVHFDLNGTPRLDLHYHAPNGQIDLGFVRKLDPAFVLDEELNTSPALVIHALIRDSNLFTETADSLFPVTDPVETVLDLIAMGLRVQADELINRLRKEARL